MSKIEWKVGPAKHRRGDDCEIVAVLENGMPVVKHCDGFFSVHLYDGVHDQDGDQSEWDLLPPRERREGYLWVLKTNGKLHNASMHKAESSGLQNIPITVELNDAGDWELVK